MPSLEMFPDAPRKPRRVMMHVSDAGMSPWTPAGGTYVRWHCAKCDHEEREHDNMRSVTENKRGKPCPKCNK